MHRAPLAILLASGLALVTGCGQAQPPAEPRTDTQTPANADAPQASPQTAANFAITLDGDVSEWPANTYAAVDDRYAYFRFRLDDETALGRPASPIRLTIDLDGNANTGDVRGTRGIELDMLFGDPSKADDRGPPITITGEDGPIDGGRLGLIAAPTHASDWHEIRIDRLSREGSIVGITIESDGLTVLEPAGGRAMGVPIKNRPRGEASIPAKAADAVRVLSWNVLWQSPVSNPGAFARVITAVRPDVILFQEWDRDGMSDAAVAGWLNTHAADAGPGEGPWIAETNNAWGVAVASRHRLTARGPDRTMPDSERWNFPVRVATAAVETPLGPIVFGSVHTKCCGTYQSDEDTHRLAEADAINATLATLATQTQTPLIVVGGDFNLVGTRDVLTEASNGLDTDRTVLEPAMPMVLGDPGTMYTFVGRKNNPAIPPRLDYVLYPDTAMDVTEAFVIHTAVLYEDSLKPMGLEADDTWASDHLPVVVDLRMR